MKLLKYIRENITINRIIRQIIKKFSKLSSSLFDFLIKHWPPSGILQCQFKQYHFKFFNKCDDGLANFFYYNLPYYEQADLNLFIELAKKSNTIIDIGANTGLFSVLASAANPKAKIYSFEPYHINTGRLKKNLNLNSAGNVTVLEMAVGENNGEIEMAVPKNRTITEVSSVNKEFSKKIYPTLLWDKQIVKVQTLDDFSKKNNLKIDLIKCDVETFEMSVFRGAEEVLKHDKPVIIFECFFDDERKSFFNNILKEYGYYLYLILEQGVVYSKEGLVNTHFGLNYLITPIKPSMSFISYKDTSNLWSELLFSGNQS